MAMDCIKLPGRVLYLSEDPSKIHRQIHGEDLPLEAALPLRNEVSVDEIAPAWVCYYFGERLEDFPYLGLACNGSFPVTEGAVIRGRFQVVVSGERHGTRGAREAALFAEFASGIRLVLARSFDPEYLQHCHDLGLLTSTDFGILDLLRAGAELPMELFTRGQDPFTAEIIRNGGLFGFTHARISGNAVLPLPAATPRPMTYAEKILARAARAGLDGAGQGLPAVAPGDGLLVRADWRYSHETATNLAAAMLDMFLAEQVPFHDPAHILAFRDHLSFVGRFEGQEGFPEVARRLQGFQDSFCATHGIHLHGELPSGAAEGISHVLMADRYVLPGQVVLGTDAHASHSGALGALAFGVDAAEIANAWVNGDVRVTVPATCLVRLDGRLRPSVSAKDLVLHLLAMPALRDGRCAGQIIEFQGEALAFLSTDERATLTNMAPVFGARTGIIAPDFETQRFLLERRSVQMELEPWMHSDPDAQYACEVRVDCGAVGAMVAAPGDPANGLALDSFERDVPVDIAYVGSCTGGKRDDIERVYEVVRWALEHQLTVPLHVQLFIQLGSEDVRHYAETQGWLEAFEAAGARVISPGCGACIHAGPGISTRPGQVTIAAFNRNFPGRSGPGPVWLGSPATVAASAFRGRICAFDALQTWVRQ